MLENFQVIRSYIDRCIFFISINRFSFILFILLPPTNCFPLFSFLLSLKKKSSTYVTEFYAKLVCINLQ